jgi:hypothetical protein
MRPVAFDIETTGFTYYDRVTVFGLQLPMGSWMMLQTRGISVDEDALTHELEERSGKTARVRVYEDEHSLLEAISEVVEERIVSKNGIYMVGYNAEVSYKGGFDLPFLRSAYNKHNLKWPFTSAYVDIYPAIKTYINTTVEGGDELNDLVGAYDTLIGDGDGDYDPFDDSSEAVDAWDNAGWGALLSHCMSDIRRTQALAELAETYIPKKSRRMVNLSPW